MDVLISQGFLYRLALFMLVAVAYVYCIRNTLKSRTLGERRAQFIKARGLETQHLQSGGLAYMAPQTYPI